MNIVLTRHAKDRLIKRKVTFDEVKEILQYPDIVVKKHGKHYFRKDIGRGVVELVCEKTESNINIITLYWV